MQGDTSIFVEVYLYFMTGFMVERVINSNGGNNFGVEHVILKCSVTDTLRHNMWKLMACNDIISNNNMQLKSISVTTTQKWIVTRDFYVAGIRWNIFLRHSLSGQQNYGFGTMQYHKNDGHI